MKNGGDGEDIMSGVWSAGASISKKTGQLSQPTGVGLVRKVNLAKFQGVKFRKKAKSMLQGRDLLPGRTADGESIFSRLPASKHNF